MAKIAKRFTDTEIKSTKPADKEINLFDGDSLILRIAPLAKGVSHATKICHITKELPINHISDTSHLTKQEKLSYRQ